MMVGWRATQLSGGWAAVASDSTNTPSAFGASQSRLDYLAVAP